MAEVKISERFKPFHLIVDTKKELTSEKIKVSQNDLNSAKLFIGITQDGNPLPLTNAGVKAAFKKPDGKLVFQDQKVEIEDAETGSISIVLTTQTVAVVGDVLGEIHIEEEGKRIVTSKFRFYVEESFMSDSTIESTNELGIIEKAIEAGEKLEGVDVPALVASKEIAEEAKAKSEENANQIGILSNNITGAYVKAFGAKGDGTDETTIFQTAINSFTTEPGLLVLEQGKEYIVENINVTKSFVILGNGSALKAKTTGASIFTSTVAKTVAFRDLIIRNTENRDVAAGLVSMINIGMLNSISVANPKNSGSSAIDIANYAGQGTANKLIQAIFHNYTDSDMMWLDNVGDKNTILRLNNANNALRRADKASDYVGTGDFILLSTKDVASNSYKPIFKIDKNGDLVFDGEGFFKTERKISNYKPSSTTVPAFIINTPSGTHSDVVEVRSGGSDRKVIGIGMHASGILGLLNVGSLMTNGLAITFNTIDANSHLKFGTAGNPRTVPNVRTGTAAPSSNAEFVGQEFIDTTNKKVYKAVATGTGVNDWVVLN